jgi:glyoxylase-like metal-dependent hydrolase (beta-lactamase superfamily II)
VSPSVELFPARTPTLPPATHTNSYAVGAREVVLVEPATPYPDEQRAWVEWASALPSTGRTPIAIVVTHHHIDHVGGIDVLARELDLPVWAHAETAQRVPVPFARSLVEGDSVVLEGPVPERWEVLHTPGHAPDHVCLYEPRQRAVLVGDMVASVGTILIAPGDGDMRVYLAQLERLARLDARVALPAHGEPIAEPTALFRQYVAHRLMREAKAIRALRRRAEGTSARELLPEVYDDVPEATWPLALLSLSAHLDKLVGDGVARVAREGPEARYIPAVGAW